MINGLILLADVMVKVREGLTVVSRQFSEKEFLNGFGLPEDPVWVN